jgi:hypothetical protein
MLFIDQTGLSDLSWLGSPSAIVFMIMLLIALLVMPVMLRLFSSVFRLAFIASVVVLPVYLVLPMLH